MGFNVVCPDVIVDIVGRPNVAKYFVA